MRTLFGLTLTAALAFGHADAARAQMAYAGRPAPGPSYAQPYKFSDESLFSINRSYLGYSNFVYRGPGGPPAPGYVTGYGAPRSQVYTPAPVPARRGGWFWRRQGYRY